MLDNNLIKIVPSERQMQHQQMEFYAFMHYSLNTYTGSEWGNGNESTQLLNPSRLDTDQWVQSIKAAGMKGIIFTCKHHDGFCLWPSQYTERSIKNSPYKDGKGDIVKELSESCKKYDVKFGVYLSPWDRGESTYGTGEKYDDYFVNQLTELLTQYGDVFSVWFDGACGEGANGKKQYYDWERYYSTVRELMPEACITICGEDVRWCGNEAGDTRECEWSVVPRHLTNAEKIASKSQQVDDGVFSLQKLKSSDRDLGSRKALENEKDLMWYPAEVDVSLRPGWFYHEEEDNCLRSLEDLMNIYYRSVGGNCMLLLNVPPNKEGVIHENDVKRLKEMGDYIKEIFAYNHMQENLESLCASEDDGEHSIINVIEDSYENYFKTSDGVREVSISAQFKEKFKVKHIVLKENIKLSQRIEKIEIEYYKDNQLITTVLDTTIGYKKIICTPEIEIDRIIIKIKDARVAPTIAFFGVY